jgi:hypothetical protein
MKPPRSVHNCFPICKVAYYVIEGQIKLVEMGFFPVRTRTRTQNDTCKPTRRKPWGRRGTLTSLSQATVLNESQASSVMGQAIRHSPPPLVGGGSLCCLFSPPAKQSTFFPGFQSRRLMFFTFCLKVTLTSLAIWSKFLRFVSVRRNSKLIGSVEVADPIEE